MNTLDAIAKRKSIRKYKAEQIKDSALEEIIKAGKTAPNAGPFQITVIQNAKLLTKISETALTAMKNSGNDFLMSRAALPGYTPLYGAPTLLVLSAPQANPYSMANTSNAATNMTIAATDLGLGSCYMITPQLAFTADPSLAKEASIPEGFSVICAVAVGYSDGNAFSTERPDVDNVNYIK